MGDEPTQSDILNDNSQSGELPTPSDFSGEPQNLADQIKNPAAFLKAYEATKDELKQWKQKAKETEDRFKQYDGVLQGVDPDKIQQWRQAYDKAEEERLKSEKKYSELIDRYQQQIQGLSAEVEEKSKKLTQQTIKTKLQEAFLEAGGDPIAFEAISDKLMSRCRLEDDNSVVMFHADGTQGFNAKTNKMKSLAEMIEDDFASDAVYYRFFKPRNNNYGTGTPPTPGTKPRANVLQDIYSIKDPAARMNAAREQGIDR